MSTLSNDFHAFLDDVKSEFNKITGVAAVVAVGVAKDAETALTTLVEQVPGVIAQAAQAAVAGALASGGNVAAILTAAEAAAINTLVQVGKPLLEADLASLKASVLAYFVAASAATGAAPSAGTAAS